MVSVNPKHREKETHWGVLTIMLFFTMGGVYFMSGSGDMLTGSTVGGYPNMVQDPVNQLKVVLPEGEIEGALFDVILKLPKESRSIIPGEDLLVSVELINFGSEDKTPTKLTYIITSARTGDVVYIEHEERIIETQGA